MQQTLVNFYEELGLDRDDSADQIAEKLATLKLQLASKAGRPSSQQEMWQRQLELVGQAEGTFADEDARERYDVELGRLSRDTSAEPTVIDWTTRAWNYYFIGDNGAAMVAARKAKEQHPDHAMPFVVSAWIQLRDNEVKTAKQDADEAFVLDELTADTVDVQMVRGTVYFLLEDYARAIASFDRALTKASTAEQTELHWRRSLALGASGDHQAAFDSAMTGLTIDVEIVTTMRQNLERAICVAINNLDFVHGQAKANVDRYTKRLAIVETSAIAEPSRSVIVGHVKANIEAQQLRAATEETIATASAVPGVQGLQPGVPLISIGGAFFGFLITLGLFAASAVAGLIGLAIVAAFVARIVTQFKGRTAWKAQRDSYADAQVKLAAAQEKLNTLSHHPVQPPHDGR